jgi:hypothetical protein
MEQICTTVEVIEALGGNQAVAALTDSTNKAVSNWRKFETFPSNTYLAITTALQAIDKTAPAALWAMKVPAEAAQ